MTCTSVQNNVVNHIALVFGVVEAKRAAEVFREVVRCIVVVTGLHMHGEGIPEIESETERRVIKPCREFMLVYLVSILGMKVCSIYTHINSI